ncbi:hypothetical protein I3271_00905 [Photobacterium leiognathi]|uniref:hypothetical protein n=1 Tax=Photobacterium leiognathi TaxID=553611 RepID=UPI001EDD789A|nr:hypothetical protein [Photobacterium leiognathi]MCG3883241.1 hypothetical protein [Photobacterium leiognathi]
MKLAYIVFCKNGKVMDAGAMTSNKDRITAHLGDLLSSFKALNADSFLLCVNNSKTIKSKLVDDKELFAQDVRDIACCLS